VNKPSSFQQKGTGIGEFSTVAGHIPGSRKDNQSITADWLRLQDLIEGVQVREVKNVCKRQGGVLTELFRRDWALDEAAVDQIFQNILQPGEISGWHVHQFTTDRIFVNWGHMQIGLYDARTGSPSFGRVNEFQFGTDRPALVIVPPGVWHAVKNNTGEASALINIVDRAYRYENPDHWRLPIDTPEIPYKFI
jgi:dTDP-4-dehydrorhamnose 3,5-epimerase